MNWTQSGFDALLKAMDSNDCGKADALDQCIWTILTSSADDLEHYVANLWSEPLDELPISIQCLIAKQYALEKLAYAGTNEFVEKAYAFLAAHGEPSIDKALYGAIEKLLFINRA
ncbi:hypothetical protein J2X32_003557 [Rheinheimera pacifica]|uniref:hypothetical protein n=1 Tax=Rheinheimera pacifica TaxID=173990 RepID=UPI0028630114|nr:hypothetical protein [Rheinheimera pacifica]MDR6984902.1 hypothetical protein [Rheinheimera pacifica]